MTSIPVLRFDHVARTYDRRKPVLAEPRFPVVLSEAPALERSEGKDLIVCTEKQVLRLRLRTTDQNCTNCTSAQLR